MYKIPTLNAGASDLRLSGDQTQRGTYTQRRRGIMAAAQGGRIGFKRGRVVEPGGYGGEWTDEDWSWSEPSSNDHAESFPDNSSPSSNETYTPDVDYSTQFEGIDDNAIPDLESGSGGEQTIAQQLETQRVQNILNQNYCGILEMLRPDVPKYQTLNFLKHSLLVQIQCPDINLCEIF